MIWIARQQNDSSTPAGHRNQHVVPEAAALEFGAWPPPFRHLADHVAASEEISGVRSDNTVRLESVDDALANRGWLTTPMRPEQ